jgi:hypothetical protein
MVLAEDKSPVEELIRQAKVMLHPQRGCLAVICDDDDLPFVKSTVSSPMPPVLHLHHSSMFAFMASSGDDRFSAYHTVSCLQSVFHNVFTSHTTSTTCHLY